MKIHLKGITKHGKDRVHQKGSLWRVLSAQNTCHTTKHRGLSGPFFLIQPDAEGVLDMRWVSANDDPDFEVSKIDNE